MTKLDRKKPYGTIVGHAFAQFEQDGLLFDGAGNSVSSPPPQKKSAVEAHVLETDAVVSAKAFLKNILTGTTLTKSVIYKTAEENNQSWDAVKTAAADIGVVKFTYSGKEQWKLPEEQN
jgi:hypothetical protein